MKKQLLKLFDLYFQLYNMEQIKIGSGLQNLGNTCFFNAVMQSVLHTKKLAMYFSNKNHSANCKKDDWCVFCQMEKTYHTTRSNRVYSPYNLVNNLKKVFKKFKLGRQQDSHQFLRYLIEGMQQCQTGKLGKDRQKNENSIKRTKVFNIFGGIIKNVVLCLSCKHKSITKQRYYDLNIECQKSNSVDEGLQKFFAADELKGQNKYNCQSCKNRVDATKRFYLQSAPQTLTFQLKRFTNTLRKIGKFVKYPKFIQLGKYFDHQRKTVARLSAVIVHAGGCASSGHYFSYVRTGQDWYRMDDSYVSKCSEQQAMGQNAYIIFYEKVKDQSLQKQIKTETIKQMQDQSLKNGNKQHKKQQSEIQINKTINRNNKQQNNEQSEKKIVQQITKHQKKQINIVQKDRINGVNGVNGVNGHYGQFNSIKIKGQKITLKQQTDEEVHHKKNEHAQQKNKFKRDCPDQLQDDQQDDDIPLPGPLQRKRSKQQAQQNMTIEEYLNKMGTNLRNLQSKLPASNLVGNRGLRSIYNLRKYQISMKKRKLC